MLLKTALSKYALFNLSCERRLRMATQKSSDLVVAIHPVSLISISDYHTRSRANGSTKDSSPNHRKPLIIVAGALLGLQTGREVTIEIVFELAFTNEGIIDETFLTSRLDQYKQTFPNLDFIGWFTTAALSPSTLQIHNLFTSLNPLPILLILDPSGLSASHADALPIKVYESIPSAGEVEVGQVEFRLETGEAERIGVEHVSKAQKKSDGERTDADELLSVLQTQASAIRMLQSRIETIKEYLVEVQEGKTPPDEHMLKEISSLLYRLPAASTPEFSQEFEGSWGGVLLASLFTEILKGSGDISDLSQKVALTTESRRKRLGMAGRMPRGRGMAGYGEPMGFDPFYTGTWSGKEV